MASFPTISAIPHPPSRDTDSGTFTTRANEFLRAFPKLQKEVNAFAKHLTSDYQEYLEEIRDKSESSLKKVTELQSEADDIIHRAEEVRKAAERFGTGGSSGSGDSPEDNPSFGGQWEDLGGSFDPPLIVYHEGSYWTLTRFVPNIYYSEPNLSNADWTRIEQKPSGQTPSSDEFFKEQVFWTNV